VLQHLIDSPWTVPNGVRKACELLDLCFFVGHRYYVEGELNTAERHLRRGMLNKILVCSLPEYSFIKNSKFVPNIAMFRVLNPLSLNDDIVVEMPILPYRLIFCRSFC
jgi:hypothetical protein